MRCKRTLFWILLFLCAGAYSCKNGDDSTNSSEQPQITSVSPSQLNPGVQDVEGSIFGRNLVGVQSVNMGDGIVVERFSGLSSSEIYIFISVMREAPPGPRTISIQTNGGVATSSGTFTVGDNVMPLATFTISPPAGTKATNFRFDASNSNDPDGSISDYRWSFGDGRTGTGRVVNHQYDAARDFDVKLTVTDNRSATHTASRTLFVDASKPPVASFKFNPSSGNIGTTFTFDASASRDPDGQIRDYRWNFADGKSGNGRIVEHQFSTSSVFPVQLVVTDNTRMSAAHTQFVRVGTPPPGDDDDDDDDGGGAGECRNPASDRGLIFGTVIGVDGSNAIVRLPSGSTCANSFYMCGDMRRADPERFRGIIKRMEDLGNDTFSIFNDCPFEWPPDIGEEVFLIHKTCSNNFCP
jgi:PKD repeat protein